MYSVCSGCKRFTVSSCISWCKGSASDDEDAACMLADDACMLEDEEDEEDEDEDEVSEDAAAACS